MNKKLWNWYISCLVTDISFVHELDERFKNILVGEKKVINFMVDAPLVKIIFKNGRM